MAQWKWAGLQVLDDWDSGKDSRTAQVVYEAMFEATRASDPGDVVPFSKTSTLRVIRTATAAIYFHASEPGGPDAPGTLYLARVVDI